MNEMKTKSLWWWPWQTEKVESMLEGMAGQGWHMARARRACTAFVFEKGEPRQVRYCVDYQDKEKPEYRTLLSDAGWALAHRESGWYIWRKAYDGDNRPELFTDIDSLIRRNAMILGSLTAVFAAQVPLFVVNINNLDTASPFGIALLVFWALLFATMGGITLGMSIGLSRMKRKVRDRGR